MEMLLRSSERMSKARKGAIAKLRAMSFDELVAVSLRHTESTTAEFLSNCNACEIIGSSAEATSHSSDEYSVAAPSFYFDQFIVAPNSAITVTRERALGAFTPTGYGLGLAAA